MRQKHVNYINTIQPAHNFDERRMWFRSARWKWFRSLYFSGSMLLLFSFYCFFLFRHFPVKPFKIHALCSVKETDAAPIVRQFAMTFFFGANKSNNKKNVDLFLMNVFSVSLNKSITNFTGNYFVPTLNTSRVRSVFISLSLLSVRILFRSDVLSLSQNIYRAISFRSCCFISPLRQDKVSFIVESYLLFFD